MSSKSTPMILVMVTLHLCVVIISAAAGIVAPSSVIAQQQEEEETSLGEEEGEDLAGGITASGRLEYN